jgi:hypothetical protein
LVVVVAAFVPLVLSGLACGAENVTPDAACARAGVLGLVALVGAPSSVVLGGAVAARRGCWRPFAVGAASAGALVAAAWAVALAFV